MSAIAPLTINDGATTPVAHTFGPAPDVASSLPAWVDRSGGISLGFPRITMSMRQPTKTARSFKVMVKIVTPVLEVTSPSTASGIQPAPTLAYNLIANIEFVLPERSTLQQRKDLFAYTKNFLANAVASAAIQDTEPVW